MSGDAIYLPTVDRARHHIGNPARPGWSMCGVRAEHPATLAPTGAPCVHCVAPQPVVTERARSFDVACGTAAGYKRHRRANEPACVACREANRVYKRAKRGTL